MKIEKNIDNQISIKFENESERAYNVASLRDELEKLELLLENQVILFENIEIKEIPTNFVTELKIVPIFHDFVQKIFFIQNTPVKLKLLPTASINNVLNFLKIFYPQYIEVLNNPFIFSGKKILTIPKDINLTMSEIENRIIWLNKNSENDSTMLENSAEPVINVNDIKNSYEYLRSKTASYNFRPFQSKKHIQNIENEKLQSYPNCRIKFILPSKFKFIIELASILSHADLLNKFNDHLKNEDFSFDFIVATKGVIDLSSDLPLYQSNIFPQSTIIVKEKEDSFI